MRKERFGISAPAVVAAALIYYLSATDKLLAVLLPVIFHELGHILALRLLGLRICRFQIELKGLCMESRGAGTRPGSSSRAGAGAAVRPCRFPAGGAIQQRLAGADRRGESAAVGL